MNEMYAPEQIGVPSELGTVLKLLTKSAIRDKPADLYKWASNYFASQCNRPAAFDDKGKLTDNGRETMAHSQPYIQGVHGKPTPASPNNGAAAGKKNNKTGNASSASSPQQQQQQQKGDQDESPEQQHEEEDTENRIVDALFDKYDPNRTNLISIDALPQLIMDLKSELELDFTQDQMEDFVNSMQTDANGNIDLDEFRVSFFQG